MRRRRQKNPLLMRIIGVSVVAHIILLPILAHFGAFKKLKHEYLETQMVRLPPPVQEKEKPEAKKQQKVAKRMSTHAKSASAASHPHAVAHSNVNAPKVVASAGGGSGDDSTPTVEQGTGKAGVVPAAAPAGGSKPDGVTSPATAAKPVTETAPRVAATIEPAKPAPQPAPKPEPQPAHVPVVVDAQPMDTPQPAIPEDLRSQALDKTCVAEITVSPGGMPVDVKIAQSSGNPELDNLALDAARHWKFKPATSDGQPIESVVRLHVEFQVS